MLKLNYTYLIQSAEIHNQGYISYVEFYTIKDILDAYELKRKIESCNWVVIDCQPAKEPLAKLELVIKDYKYKKLLLDTNKLDLGTLTITL